MNVPIFEYSTLLNQAGLDHGFGTKLSHDLQVPHLCRAKQVHGRELLRAPDGLGNGEGDALWTNESGCAVGVITADCVPVLIADRAGSGVAAVHAGWKGSAAGISGFVATRLIEHLRMPAERVVAAIGPHIGACCYEVDEPVRSRIDDESVFEPVREGHYMLDLFALNHAQLVAAGVPAENIERVGSCTCCTPGRYLSYRRDGSGGRLLHYVRKSVS